MATTVAPAPLVAPSAGRRRYNAVLRTVRRIHLYAGLLLVPWVLLYGVSGIMFNHPNIGADARYSPVPADRLAARGVAPVHATDLARSVVAQLNQAGTSGGPYRHDEGFDEHLVGPALLEAPGRQVNHLVFVDMELGRAMISERSLGPPVETPPFAGAVVALPAARPAELTGRLEGLLEERGFAPTGPLAAHPKIAPVLRFRLVDGQSRPWNVTYHLGSGALDGRLSDAGPDLDINQQLTRLHTQHHFPNRFGATWLWALMADLMGLTMVLWAVTGLFMWWQVKQRRLVGAVVIAMSVGLAAYLMLGTLADAHFGKVGRVASPGGAAPPPPAPASTNP